MYFDVMTPSEERVATAALMGAGRSQHGVLTRDQIAAVLTRRQLDRWVSTGRLVRAASGQWRLAGSPVSWRQRAMGVCLAYGPPAAISHTAAARLWGLEGVTPAGVHVVVPRGSSGRRELPAVITHHGRLEPDEVAERHGIPVTSIHRTLVDLAAIVPADVVSVATDDAIRRRLITPQRLLAQHGRTRRGVAGIETLERIVTARVPQTGVADSRWEDTVFLWIVGAGLPAPVRQHHVEVRGTVFVLDMAYPHDRVAVEFDGWAWHATRRRFDRDRARSTELALAGWLVVQVTSAHTEAEVVDRVGRALAARVVPSRPLPSRPLSGRPLPGRPLPA